MRHSLPAQLRLESTLNVLDLPIFALLLEQEPHASLRRLLQHQITLYMKYEAILCWPLPSTSLLHASHLFSMNIYLHQNYLQERWLRGSITHH